jgi:hypothetical protein
LFVFHRQNWDILRPFVTLHPSELEELKQTGVYIAGFTDSAVRTREDLFDLFVDGTVAYGRSCDVGVFSDTLFCLLCV